MHIARKHTSVLSEQKKGKEERKHILLSLEPLHSREIAIDRFLHMLLGKKNHAHF